MRHFAVQSPNFSLRFRKLCAAETHAKAWTAELFKIPRYFCSPAYIGEETTQSTAANNKDTDSDADKNTVLYDFHDYLKAESLGLRVPVQIVLPATYDETKHSAQKKIINRDQQDEATRAWNLHTALYYKSRGVPWRMIRQEADLSACFLGVSFFRTLDRQKLYANSAQVFNERGEGVVVRGGLAYEDKDDRQVHLDAEGSHNLVITALEAFKDEHFHYPARIVVHKTSSFSEKELEGFAKAFKKKGIDKVDYVYLRPSHTRLFRTSNYPTLRGTFDPGQFGTLIWLTWESDNQLLY